MREDPRVFRTDTGNFNRFLTSLGLLAFAAALVIPYFYFRNTSILEIPAGDIRKMTDAGRSAIEARQDGIVELEPWVIGGAAVLAVLGLFLLIAGGIRLRGAQQSEDEEAELRRRRALLEVEKMSPAEQDERAAEKAEVEVEAEVEEALPRKSGPREQERPAEALTPSRELWSRYGSRLDEIRRISHRIEEVLGEHPPPGYDFKWQLRIGSETGEVRMDGLFEAKDPRRPDIVLQTQVSPGPRPLLRTARNRADELIATLARYEAITKRTAFGWLVLIVPEEGESEEDSAVGEGFDVLESFRAALKPHGDVVLVEERSLSMLPQLFSRRFGPA
jgi:hypothetical protein